MENNNNNNGRGIFYGVIGVATLIVAMIGATFAYFSAEASTNQVIAANSTTIDLELESQVTSGINYQLIPVDETQDGFATGGYVGVKDTSGPQDSNCVDDDGNEFCSVYTFTIKNPSATTSQKVYADMDVSLNTFNTNAPDSGSNCTYLDETGEEMYCNKSNFAFAIFKGTAANVDSSVNKWDVDGTAATTYYSPDVVSTIEMYDPLELTNGAATIKTVTTQVNASTADGNTNGTGVLGLDGEMVVARTAVPTVAKNANPHTFRLAALDQTLKPGGTVTYTVVMWLHENWEDQGNDEAQQFIAGITFSTSLGGSGVTAILSSTNAPVAG